MTHRPVEPTLKLKNPKVWQILRRARVLLQTHGWTRGSYHSEQKPDGTFSYCALGALGAAVGNSVVAATGSNRNVNAAHLLVKEVAGCSWVPDWNDAYGRTREEVITVFKEAEERARIRRL